MDKLSLEEQLELEDLYTEEDLEIKAILEDKDALPMIVKGLREEIAGIFNDKIKRFGIENINIAVMGRMGSAKSTIINGFYQALHGKFTTLAKADNSNETVTKGIKPISMVNQDDGNKCSYKFINIIDIFGEDQNKYTEAFIDDYFKGKIDFTFELEDENQIPSNWREKFGREKEKMTYMPHAVIYLFETSDLKSTDKDYLPRLQKFFNMIFTQGNSIIFLMGRCTGIRPFNKNRSRK